MSKSFFVLPVAVTNSLKKAKDEVNEAIRSGNPPEILRTPCEKCGSFKWQYQWGTKWRCGECGIWVEDSTPQTLEEAEQKRRKEYWETFVD